MFPRGITFDDVLLVPGYNGIRSRQSVTGRRVVVLPGWPELGRTCAGGVVWVHGRPIGSVLDHLPGADVVPVLFTKPKDHAIDIVIHPDGGNPGMAASGGNPGIGAATSAYPKGWLDPTFLSDVSTIVNGALLEPTYLQYQDKMNIWISQRTGAPGWPPTGDGGTLNSTIGLSDGKPRASWADVAEIIHRRQIPDTAMPPVLSNTRDAAKNGLFTVNALVASAPNIMRHEMGHAAFGLADEYCCDGGYDPQKSQSNVFNTLDACTKDLPDLAALNAETTIRSSTQPSRFRQRPIIKCPFQGLSPIS